MSTQHLSSATGKFMNAFLILTFFFILFLPISRADEKAPEHGLNLTGMDRTVQPGDDFFAYANGAWVQATEIPADRSSYSSFGILRDEVDQRTASLIQDAERSGNTGNPNVKKIADYYSAFMDEKTIEALGMTPLKPEMEAIAAIRDRTELARLLGGQMRADVDPLNWAAFHTDHLFGLWVSPDFDHPNRNAGYLLQGGLGMPDRDYYLKTDENSAALQEKYRRHITDVLKLCGIEVSDERAQAIYDLEYKIAETHVSRTDSFDVLKANNRWLLSDFPDKAPGLNWSGYFESAGLGKQKDLFVWHPSAVIGIAALVGSEPLEVWKDYLTFHVIDRGAPLLSKSFVDENFVFYGSALLGAKELRDRWKRAVSATNNAMGDAVGKLYVDRYFPPSAKKEAQEMVRNIIAAFDRRIDRLDWMSPETRAKAKAKVKTLYVGVGYPEKWRDFTDLKVKRDDAFGNAHRSELFDYRTALAKLNQPVDKSEWWITPQTVNAINIPLQNAMNFPAAILDRPFFDAETDPAQNYGGIGVVIGHEISHSFDDQGSQFDEEGRLENWWTPEDLKHFQSAADRLVAQYDAYEPLPGSHVNGKLTLSENIADVAGIAAAHDGYRSVYDGKEGPSAQGFTGDQRFFLSFAQIWRSKMRPEALRNSLLTNGHSPGEYRADTVRNIDAWYSAFDVQSDQKLYLAPDKRVQVW